MINYKWSICIKPTKYIPMDHYRDKPSKLGRHSSSQRKMLMYKQKKNLPCCKITQQASISNQRTTSSTNKGNDCISQPKKRVVEKQKEKYQHIRTETIWMR